MKIAQISNRINNFINTFVYGSLGSGKTAILKHAISDFNTKAKGKAVYIDCSLYKTVNAVLREILAGISSLIASKSNYELIKRLKEKAKHQKLIVCLDHFEALEEVEIVSILLGLGLNFIIVANSFEAYRRLDSAMKASIANMLSIPEYNEDQVFEILNEMAEQALERYSYSEDVIRRIAEKCKGNVAFGMSILKALALKAESEGKSSIEDVDTELKGIDCHDERLSLDEKVILKILGEWKSLPAGRLYDFYKAKSKHSKSERSFRNYMQKLCEKGLVRSFELDERRRKADELILQA